MIKTFFRWVWRLAVTLLILVVLLVALTLILKDVISKSLTERSLRNGTGMDASIAKMEIGLTTPTVSLEGLKLYNTTNFGGDAFLEMPELRVEYVPGEIRSGKAHLKVVRLNIAELHIVKDKTGRTNLDLLEKLRKEHSRAEKKDQTAGSGPDFGGIDTLYLSVGKLKITDLASPQNDCEINVNLKDYAGHDLKTKTDVDTWLNGVLLKILAQQYAKNPDQPGVRWLLENRTTPKRLR